MATIDLDPAALIRPAIRLTAGRREIIRSRGEQAKSHYKIAEVIGLRAMDQRPLNMGDYERAASMIDVHPAALHAFADVESGSLGAFDEEGRLIIAVEPHVFSRRTAHAYDKTHPHLSYPRWIPYRKGPPKGWQRHPYALNNKERWFLWANLADLNFEAALGCLSVGLFQPMIYHGRSLGYPNRQTMITLLSQNTEEQLECLVRFLEYNGISRHIRNRAWRKVAAAYNGRGQVAYYALKFTKRFEVRKVQYA